MTRLTIILAAIACAAVPAAAQSPRADIFTTDQDGFIQNWLILDPVHLTGIQHTEEGIQSIVSRDSFAGLLTATPRAGETVTVDGQEHRWQPYRTEGYVIDLTGNAAKQEMPVVNVAFWGVAYVMSPQVVADARLSIGSDDSSVWWVNGQQVIGAYGVRQTATDDNVSGRLTLRRGVNVVRFAVIQGDGPGDCCVRFFDARQRPVTNLSVSLDPRVTATVAQTAAEPAGQRGTRGQRGQRGDLALAGRSGFRRTQPDPNAITHLSDIRMRDVCILPDPATGTYYMVGPGGNSVRVYTSKDLRNWQGPRTVFSTPPDIWGDIRVRGIWAPEMHKYQGKYYLFLTFDTNNLFDEQWPNWRPRVTRGSTILVSDSPFGPFEPFQNRSTLPTDMMTLDATLYVEDGKPYIVYCHEWVQISNGTIEYMGLTDDLSEVTGEPTLLFRGSDGPWQTPGSTEGGFVTDGCYFYQGKSGKLFMTWSGFNNDRYTVGLAISDSGKLAGPWRQQAEPLFTENGGHAMFFNTFEGTPMMVLHAPNGGGAQPLIFELEDTGETLRVVRPFTGE